MLRRLAPELVCALVATALRGAVAAAQWTHNPALRTPTLDAAYYLDWAHELAGGHLTSAGPAGADGPYLLNPLYAWLIAPLTAVFDPAQPGVLALQAVLGGATAWLAAAAARRFANAAGPRAATLAATLAGLAVACSTPLVHLATHVSVATLAAFLVAGAVLALAPATESERGHGPLAAGLWLGVGALARPVTLLAVPFVAAVHWLRGDGRGAARSGALLVVLAFSACAGIAFARNVAVSGEPVVFTAANGLNLHLGQNPMARRTSSMMTDEFRFGPVEMHTDAKHRVGRELGREPTRSEISGWYRSRALDDIAAHPGDALAFFGRKVLWFFSPEEPPSSADLRQDLTAVPLLRAAFVPTWLLSVLWLAALGVGSLRIGRGASGRRALTIGVGGLVLAHVLSGALAFPLSHYRAPVVPALAVAAAVGITGLSGATSAARVRTGVLLVLGLLSAWVVSPPPYVHASLKVNDAVDAIRVRNGAAAEAAAAEALREEPDWFPALTAMSEAQILLGDRGAALHWIELAVARQRWNVAARHLRAELLVDLARPDEAIDEVESLVAELPWSADARGARGELRAFTGDADGAREDLEWAMARGFDARGDALARIGMSRGD